MATCTAEISSGAPAWPWALRLGFRFAFCWWVLYLLPFPFGSYPGRILPLPEYDHLWYRFVPWVGAHLLHLRAPITDFPGSSGDTTFNYVQLLCLLVLAVAATLLWSVLDRRRASYPKLNAALRIYVRYALALTMLYYGMDKVIKLQFPDTTMASLIEPFGGLSPAGLLWRFMGFSAAYTHFAGWGETIGAVLLFFRRTTTLGALLLVGVLSNVVMLNFCYDVPVKIFSSSLLAMALFLLLPEARRLWNFLVLNHATAPARLDYPFTSPMARWLHRGGKTIALAAAAYFVALFILKSPALRPGPAPGPWDGIYQVTDSSGRAASWQMVAFDKGSRMSVLTDEGAILPYAASFDQARHQLRLNWGKKTIYALSYAGDPEDSLVLSGTDVRINLAPAPEADSELVHRGFHWISEYSVIQ